MIIIEIMVFYKTGFKSVQIKTILIYTIFSYLINIGGYIICTQFYKLNFFLMAAIASLVNMYDLTIVNDFLTAILSGNHNVEFKVDYRWSNIIAAGIFLVLSFLWALLKKLYFIIKHKIKTRKI